ncbi:MAG: hypothetical protein ACOYLE_04735 [Bacteroidales bacterium]
MMNKIKHFLCIFGLLFPFIINAQTLPFNILLEPLNIPELDGLQSYAYGQYDGKWLIIGGRIDGLHRRQPFASFDIDGNNTQLLVIDPLGQQKWIAPLTSLSTALQEQLKSSNMEFYQLGDYLYLLGGYGYSPSIEDHTTFNNLTAIDVPATINAIIKNTDLTSFFRQINDSLLQVTGGELRMINNSFYLVGGQKFIGRYNPMGPEHGPGFLQEYTNQIRKFNIEDNGRSITINHVSVIIDENNLHRRDYNLVSQIMPNGQEGLTAFSGVFQKNLDLPFLNCVNIDSNEYNVNKAFTQYYNHYHCAVLPLYSASNNVMHSVFFGGIAQYFDDEGILTQDNNVPFVKTIANVTRDANGKMAEYKLNAEMPALLGAGSEFIANENLAKYPNGVIKLDEIKTDTTFAGYVFGGISSTETNIFWINDGTQSNANSQIYKVFLTKNPTSKFHILNEQSTGTLKIMHYPVTNDNNLVVKYNLSKTADVKLSIYELNGKKIEDKIFKNKSAGENIYKKKIRKNTEKRIYILSIETDYEKAIQKIIIEP